VSAPAYCANCAREFNATTSELCGVCRYVPAKSRSLGDSVALTGGEWVLRGGIKVWREFPPAPVPETVTFEPVETENVKPCCGTKVGRRCATPIGACHDCGQTVEGQRIYCDKHQLQRRRATWRKRQQRKRRREVEQKWAEIERQKAAVCRVCGVAEGEPCRDLRGKPCQQHKKGSIELREDAA